MTAIGTARPADATALRAAFAVFAVAGLVGALFRFVVAYGWSVGLDPVNVRHAHSHLMYFGWATPALFVLLGMRAVGGGSRPVPARLLAWTLGLAVVTGLAFLPWGYEPAQFGPARVPVTIILSTLCMVTWYAWVAWYRSARRSLVEATLRPLVDAAAAFLALSTLGAWSVVAMVPFGGAGDTLKLAFAHFFLQVFSEGWFTLGLLTLAWSRLPDRVRVPGWALAAAGLGILVGFLLSLPSTALPLGGRVLARIAGVSHGVGIVALAWTWWRSAPASARSSWGLPVLLLAAKGATQVLAVGLPGPWWADMATVRVLYLHLLLLGFVSLGIAAETLSGAWLRMFQAVCLSVVASLVPFTALWPFAPPGMAAFEAAAWISVLPPLVAAAALVGGRVRAV